jgi:hypothetical protein
MWKFIGAVTVALAIASTPFLYAQQARPVHVQQPTAPDDGQLWQRDSGGFHEFGEPRLAALKSALMLTPDQVRNWAAFEQAARDFRKLRMDRRIATRTILPSDDPVERLRQRATAMSETVTALKKLAEAMEPLYSSLDENQKRHFAMHERSPGLNGNH